MSQASPARSSRGPSLTSAADTPLLIRRGERRRGAPPWGPYAALLLAWAIGTGLVVGQATERFDRAVWSGADPWITGAAMLMVVAAMSVGLFYLLGIVAKSAWYIMLRSPACAGTPGAAGRSTRPVVVLYLTAGDFDAAAVDSLLRLRTSGPRLFLLHDDGQDDAARSRMRRMLEGHPEAAGWEIQVWHRPKREGGKAGAVNWVLGRLDPKWELMLLCDSDSIALDPDAIQRAEIEFDDASVTAVQCRNTSYCEADEPAFHRSLARAIDVFDALAAPRAAWGYVPFMGHNAMLRLDEVRRLGGLTPGFFSDDLDLSARMTIAGKRIVYRRDIVFAERHPPDLDSFRKRSRKWAYGCTQVVRTRAWEVLTTPGIPFAHRVGLLEFMFFYPCMLLLLTGLMISHLVLPILAPAFAISDLGCFLVGLGVVLALLTPTLAWAIKSGNLLGWPAFAWRCILVYGGSLLPTVRGVIDGLSPRERPWIPTNLAAKRPAVPRVAVLECLLGVILIAVPWTVTSQELMFPSTYLFVSVFLFSPLTFMAYRQHTPAPDPAAEPAMPDREPGRAQRRRGRRLAAPAAAAMVVLVLAVAARGQTIMTTRGDRLIVEGRPVQIRGIHYSPWLPGTGPDGKSDYPSIKTVAPDLDRIVKLGANTVLIHSAPGWVIDEARRRGLLVVYKFHIPWNDTSQGAFDAAAEAVLTQHAALRDHDGVVLWILGNEVPRWVVDELGPEVIAGRLAWLAGRIRETDPTRLIGHQNWPVTKEIPADVFDVVCFNLYPAWPYEVSVRGFGPYLREVLLPIAGDKPLLITEFGLNSLEAGEERQARVIAECWREIDASRIAGGIVFAYADEWWKNFDNPIPGKGYWQREYAPDDALTHDDDPEEYYGIVRTDRSPKPAFAAVAEMWGGSATPSRSYTPFIVLAVLGVATWYILGLSRRDRRESGGTQLEAQDPAIRPTR